MADEPSIFSKQHPTRLLFRAVLLVIASPFLVVMGFTSLGEDQTRGMIGIGAGLLFALFGGFHLWGVWSERS